LAVSTVAVLLLIPGVSARAQRAQPAPSIDSIVAGVRAGIQVFLSSLPDMVCDETIRSYEVRGRKEWRKIQLGSEIEVKREDGSQSFKEVRNFHSMNGKLMAQGTTLQISMPLVLQGGFSNDFAAAFQPEFVACNEYRIVQSDAKTLTLEVSQRQPLPATAACGQLNPGDVYLFLLERSSWRIERAERHGPQTHVNDFKNLSWITQFALIPLGDKTYNLPTRVDATLKDASGKHQVVYTADYRNYHRFSATIKIMQDNEAPPQ
jgi:hypothetical protein